MADWTRWAVIVNLHSISKNIYAAHALRKPLIEATLDSWYDNSSYQRRNNHTFFSRLIAYLKLEDFAGELFAEWIANINQYFWYEHWKIQRDCQKARFSVYIERFNRNFSNSYCKCNGLLRSLPKSDLITWFLIWENFSRFYEYFWRSPLTVLSES